MTDDEIRRMLREALGMQLGYVDEWPCPRCGAMTMRKPIAENSMSGYAPIRICDECKKDEIRRAFDVNIQPKPFRDWEIVKKVEGRE